MRRTTRQRTGVRNTSTRSSRVSRVTAAQASARNARLWALRDRTGYTIPASLSSVSREVKALVVSRTSTVPAGAQLNINTTGSIIPLNMIQTGSSFFNRIGRKIEMKSLQLEVNVTPVSAARTSVSDTARFLIVYDRQTNGALPTLSDMFQDTDQGGNNTSDAQSNINLNNRDRFMIVRDYRVMLPAITNTVTGVPSAYFPSVYHSTNKDGFEGAHVKDYVKLKGLVTQYKADSTPAVIGDIATGALYLVTFGMLAAGSEGYAIHQWNTRLRYYDN